MRFSAAGRAVLVTGLLAALTLSGSACGNHPPVEEAATVTPKTPPTAAPVPPDPRVGAVFLGGGALHTCTGGVLDSAGGDLILTAAHCVAEGVDATFVAGLKDTAAPEDVWHVDAVYLDPRWVQNQDPLCRLRDRAGEPRHRRDGGGAGRRWPDARAGAETGHGRHRHRLRDGRRRRPDRLPDGHGGPTQGFPALDCAELVDGLSGAPWIDGSTVTGVIGGLERRRLRRRKRLLLTAFRRCRQAVARPRRGRRSGRRRADGVRRRLRLARGTGSARAACSSRPARRPCRPPRTSGS